MNKLVKTLVVTGPSGVGKGTLIGKLLTDYPTKFGKSVSRTSRKPREGEIDGVHYHFVDKDFLLNDINHGKYKYIEHAEVHSNIYGTRSDEVTKVHAANKICVLDVDCQGAKSIKNSGIPAKYLFVSPKSMEQLEARLRGRKSETEEQIALRLRNAKGEMEYGLKEGNFDAVLVNDDLEVAYRDLLTLLRVWFPFAKL